jgi:hypothetical protein
VHSAGLEHVVVRAHEAEPGFVVNLTDQVVVGRIVLSHHGRAVSFGLGHEDIDAVAIKRRLREFLHYLGHPLLSFLRAEVVNSFDDVLLDLLEVIEYGLAISQAVAGSVFLSQVAEQVPYGEQSDLLVQFVELVLGVFLMRAASRNELVDALLQRGPTLLDIVFLFLGQRLILIAAVGLCFPVQGNGRDSDRRCLHREPKLRRPRLKLI